MLPRNLFTRPLTANNGVAEPLLDLQSFEEPTSPLVELKFKIYIFGTFATVVIREAAAFDCRILAHIDAPGVVGVTGEEA